MNQVITQHGWGLNKNIWMRNKSNFIKKNWAWQDNDRGYFSSYMNKSKWIKDNSDNGIRLVLCHSLGTHLIGKDILDKATHIILINSFYNFIPANNERKVKRKLLGIMERKINPRDIKVMHKEFLNRSFYPNSVDINFDSLLDNPFSKINYPLLLSDFKKLYIEDINIKLIPANLEVLIIQSKKDLILSEFSYNSFINIMNKNQITAPKIIFLEDEGHLIKNLNFFKLLEDWII